MSSRFRPVLRAAAIVLAASLTACEDPLETAPEALLDEDLGQGIHAVLAAPASSFRPGLPEGDTITFEVHLKKVGVAGKIASYQGELKYPTQGLRFVGGEAPPGILAAWNEKEGGFVRFAGISVDGFDPDKPVLLLRFEPTRSGPIAQDAFRIHIEEVVAQGSLDDLTQHVVERAKPVFSRLPGD